MKDGVRLNLVRAVHTGIYIVMAASVFALVYAGAVGARNAWVAVALGLVAAECAVFFASGMKCPLTGLAVRYGGKPGDDTFLPERLTRYTLRFFGPLIVVGLALLIARWCGLLH